MFAAFILALIALGALTLIRVVSFAIRAFVAGVSNWLVKHNFKKGTALPKRDYIQIIEAVREKNMQLADTLEEAMKDDGKMGFAFDENGDVKAALNIEARNGDQDDINTVTNVWANGVYKQYPMRT